MRGRRAARGVVIGVICYLVLRVVAGMGSGQDTTGPYALIRPGFSYPCAPIHYVISEAETPPDFAEVVHGAVGKISAASGYRFFFDGMTGDRDFVHHVTGPVLIGFRATGENVRFAGDVIGLGGSAYDTASGHFTSGRIQLDATKYEHVADMGERQAIVMHELGHVLGLDHVDDSGEIMSAHNVGRTTLGPGDVAGLRHQYQLSCPSPTT